MAENEFILGVDAGSAAVAAVLVSPDRSIVSTFYRLHGGKAVEAIGEAIAALERAATEAGADGFAAVAATSSAPAAVRADYRTDARIAYVEACRVLAPETRTLFVVGAERFARIAFDERGRYRRMRGNSACAAGTGSFLDQQATRLGLSGSAELSELALSNDGAVPRIASRCSVFAKTDLIHAQQEGWTLAQICDGLCRGLARNIADTLFPGERPEAPALLAGGVALNAAVVRHLSEMAGSPVRTDPRGALFGALGAAFRWIGSEERAESSGGASVRRAAAILAAGEETRSYANEPLADASADYPDFSSRERFLFAARKGGERNPVEIDIYEDLAAAADGNGRVRTMLGFDIGSTSTKAALLDADGKTLVGFYTRTAGRPLEAAQSVLEAAEIIGSRAGVSFDIELCATTGSGRKLVGAVLGADASVDEITAHARAAVLLDPAIDTIIEIGGQDSKFTSIKDGTVVFSQMNTVCAAGTGSFIEEQAARLGVPIQDYAERALLAEAPLTSDRCTVFMERDLNHLRAIGYGTDELLAAALYSVCDNYLTKVAREGALGERIVFQGATAKNKALVAAFERRLGKRVRVSRFCHLTGAVGAALQARDEGSPGKGKTSFRGLGLHRADFSFRPDECDGCGNRCKLHVVEVEGEEIVYGYLCGREKGDKTYVSKDKSGFDLLRERSAALRTAKRRLDSRTAIASGTLPAASAATRPEGLGALARGAFAPFNDARRRASDAVASAVATFSANTIATLTDAVYRAADYALDGLPKPAEAGESPASARMPVIGIPRALYLAEEAPYWQRFFELLGFPVALGEETSEILAEGKRTAGAEFCAPVAMLHGQCAELLRRADFVFLPTYLEAPARKIGEETGRRFYCNYSQFAPAVVSLATGSRERYLSPLAAATRGDDSGTLSELRDALRVALEGRGVALPPPSEIRRAYRESRALRARVRAEHRELFLRAAPAGDDIAVLLAGRPYTLLSPGMNKGIPDIFAKNGVRAFFQDMAPLPLSGREDSLLDTYHWRYAAEVLEAARFCARSESHYAVLVSSFKCSPDSFAAESFKRILDDAGKPYLVLQVDEHDSSVGYETRIEAAVRAFRNHAASARKARAEGSAESAETPKAAAGPAAEAPAAKRKFPKDKTILLPNWDPIVCSLLAASLRGQGLDARELEETPEAIRRAMTLNAGQCIPVSVIAREAIDYIETKKLDPERTALWMIRSLWPCNIPLYPFHIGGILEKHGKGLEKVEVYAGDLTFLELSPQATLGAFHSFLAGGLLRKMVCRVRPYELRPGETDAAAERGRALIADALERGVPIAPAVKEVAALFKAIPVSVGRRRPKVAIFGDFYSRDNDTFNQNLGKAIEAAGGEVVVTPYVDYLKATCDAFFERLLLERRFGAWATFRSVMAAVAAAEKSLYAKTGMDSRESGGWNNEGNAKAMAAFGLRPELAGECTDNALKILRIVREHPDVALLVQANPAFCCPSIITEAMAGEIERVTGVPVVTITYDGTGSPRNDAIEPYLAFARERETAPSR